MAKKAAGIARADKADKDTQGPPTVRVRVPQGTKVRFAGFETAVVGQAATVTLTGTVREVREVHDAEYGWDNGRTLELTLDTCDVAGPGKVVEGMDEAIAATRQVV